MFWSENLAGSIGICFCTKTLRACSHRACGKLIEAIGSKRRGAGRGECVFSRFGTYNVRLLKSVNGIVDGHNFCTTSTSNSNPLLTNESNSDSTGFLSFKNGFCLINFYTGKKQTTFCVLKI